MHSDSTTTEPMENDSVNVISVVDVDGGYTRNNDSSDDDCIAMTDGRNNHNEPCCSQDMLKKSAAMALLGLKQADSGIPARCYTKHDSCDPAKH